MVNKLLVEAPQIASAVKSGLLHRANVITDQADRAAFHGVQHEAVLGGHTRFVPASAGPLAAPVLVKGTTSTSGGTFGAGTFFWKVTAVDGIGETAGSNEVTATLVATGSQALSWAAVPGAQVYRVYRGTSAGAENVLVATVSTLSYIDTGSAGTAKTVPTVSTAGPAPATAKVFDELDYFDGVEFGVYRGIESALLIDADPAGAVKAAFEGGESYAVEDAVQRLILNGAAVDLTPTPGTAVTNVLYALGLLEQYAASNYAGLPLIHGNHVALTLIPGSSLAGEGEGLHTLHGTPISIGGGYGALGPNAITAGAGKAWLFISGQVNLWQGKFALTEAKDLPDNREYALAERPYAATVDGPVAAILVGI